MVKLTNFDEYFVHQIPEPLPNTVVHHEHWRESYFFVAHPRSGNDGDVIILAMAHHPAREEMNALLMGRVGGSPVFGMYRRPYDGDPHTTVVDGARVDIVEPYKTIKISAPAHEHFVCFDLTFSARTRAHGLRRGTIAGADGIIWDQSHMVQSGRFDGTYTWRGQTYEINDWWGQRDHSWGIRDHARCPMWMWLAVQFDDGMLAVWHWELANGARIYTDGCWAPADGSEPIPVIDFHHALDWTEHGKPASYGQNGESITGLAGVVDVALADGTELRLEGEGTWAVRYGGLGGGQNLMAVRTGDGRTGNGVYEITGAHHHRYFPVERVADPNRRHPV